MSTQFHTHLPECHTDRFYTLLLFFIFWKQVSHKFNCHSIASNFYLMYHFSDIWALSLSILDSAWANFVNVGKLVAISSRAKEKVSESACLAGSKTCSSYSNSWAERFIWLISDTYLCISFFIFIRFCLFVYLVQNF